MAVWAGRLLGGAPVLGLVAGARIRSPDGARLRRLAGGRGTVGFSARARGTGRASQTSAIAAPVVEPSTDVLGGHAPASDERGAGGAWTTAGGDWAAPRGP